MDNQQGPTVYTGNSGQYYVAAARWREYWGRMSTCVGLAESLFVQLKLSQHC